MWIFRMDKYAVFSFVAFKFTSKEKKIGMPLQISVSLVHCDLYVVIFYFFSPHSLSDVKYEQSHGMTCMWICYFWCSSKCQPICYVVTAVIFHVAQYLFSSRQAAFEHGCRPLQLRAAPLLAHITNKWDFREQRMLQKIKHFIRAQF